MQATTSTMTHTDTRFTRPYAPSWLNLLMDQLERLPGAPWMYSAGLGAILAGMMTGLLWQTRAYAFGHARAHDIVLESCYADDTIERITTWPWQPDTFRIVITALFFPILLFNLQFTIQKLLTP